MFYLVTKSSIPFVAMEIFSVIIIDEEHKQNLNSNAIDGLPNLALPLR